jgi:hypothetical protein
MHHCLHIEEILASIFEFVRHQEAAGPLIVFRYDQRSVLALVKTCRTFKMPALRVLWKDLFNPIPLILTLPEDLWHVESEAEQVIAGPRMLVSDQNCLLRKPKQNVVAEFQKRDTT